MALDPAISDQLTSLTLASARSGEQLTEVLDRNLVQGLGVVQNTVIQGNATGQQFGVERTAIHVPAADK